MTEEEFKEWRLICLDKERYNLSIIKDDLEGLQQLLDVTDFYDHHNIGSKLRNVIAHVDQIVNDIRDEKLAVPMVTWGRVPRKIVDFLVMRKKRSVEL